MGEEHSSTGLWLVLLQPFSVSPFLPHASSTRRERGPSKAQSEVLFWWGPGQGTLGERRFDQSDQALCVASGKVVDVTKLLLPSMPDLLWNYTKSLAGNGDLKEPVDPFPRPCIPLSVCVVPKCLRGSRPSVALTPLHGFLTWA